MTATYEWGPVMGHGGGKTLQETLDAAIGYVPPPPRLRPPTWLDRIYREALDAALWPEEYGEGPVSYVRSRVRTRLAWMTPIEAREAVARHGGNITRAAGAEGMPRSTLRDLLRDARDGGAP
jgi:hypothetical protein